MLSATALTGKAIVITGGAGLLGRRFCQAVAEQDGLAVVAELNAPAAEQVAEEIRARGGHRHGYH